MDKEPINLSKLRDWAVYTAGARMMLLKLRQHLLGDEPHPNLQYKRKAEDKVYTKAILDLILSSKDNVYRFLMGGYEIRFTEHERNKKGKLINCRAYFAKKVIKYEEI